MTWNTFFPVKIVQTIAKSVSKIKGAPCTPAHIFTAGCTIFGGVHPLCARFLSHFVLLYIGRVHGPFSACTVLKEVHPVSAQNNSLISDTAKCIGSEEKNIWNQRKIWKPTFLVFNVAHVYRPPPPHSSTITSWDKRPRRGSSPLWHVFFTLTSL